MTSKKEKTITGSGTETPGTGFSFPRVTASGPDMFVSDNYRNGSSVKFDDDMDDMDGMNDMDYSAVRHQTGHHPGPSRDDMHHNLSTIFGGDQSRISMVDDSNSSMDGIDTMDSRTSHSSDSDSAVSSSTDRSHSRSRSPLTNDQDTMHCNGVEATPSTVSHLPTNSVSILIDALNGTGHGTMRLVDSDIETPDPTPPPPMVHQKSKSAMLGQTQTLPISVLREKRRKSAQRPDRRSSAVMPAPIGFVGSKSKSLQTPRQSVSTSARSTSLNPRDTVSSSRRSMDEAALPLHSLVKSQTAHKQTKRRKKSKNFKYRSRASMSDSSLSSSAAAVTRSFSERKRTPQDVPAGDLKKRKLKKGSRSRSKMKQYSSKRDRFEEKKVVSLSSKHFKTKQSYGGGYGADGPQFMAMDIPAHLKSYYSIQQDLHKLSDATRKQHKKRKLDAISTQLNTLFFANERTNVPNMAAFQKFFIDRMSEQSVHKDLDWHLCLLRPKIHSKMMEHQMDEIIQEVANLLRKCVKKFNNKRGHLTSAASTARIGVGTYAGGKDKNQIRAAYILSHQGQSTTSICSLSMNQSSSAPPPPASHRDTDTPTGYSRDMDTPQLCLQNMSIRETSYEDSMLDCDGEASDGHAAKTRGPDILASYEVMTPPVSVMADSTPKKKKNPKHRSLLSFSKKKKKKKLKDRAKRGATPPPSTASRPMMTETEIRELTGLPAAKKAKGSEHYNVDEPYPLELFQISDLDFVLVYYVKFLTKFEMLMVEFLRLYEQYSNHSDRIGSGAELQLSLVASNPKQSYLESMVKAYNTMQFGRSSREHSWIRIETDQRKSQKFGQDLCHVVKLMKTRDLDRMQEIMKQAPDFNTKDRDLNQSALQIALEKSKTEPSFSFVARYLALKQLMFAQPLEDGHTILQALDTGNPMVAEILMHLNPNMMGRGEDDKTCLDLALHRNLASLASFMLRSGHSPSWHTQQLLGRWTAACETGDVVKLKSVLHRGFNIDYFEPRVLKTALIICTENQHTECVRLLLDAKANVDAQDAFQRTALHHAAINMDGELFRMLLLSRANWSLRDRYHKTPLKYVMEAIGLVPRPRPEIVRAQSARPTLIGITEQDLALHDGKESRFWSIGDTECDNDSNASWDEYGFLVLGLKSEDTDGKEEEEEENKEEEETVSYPEVDVDEVIKMVDIALQAKLPLDSRLLLLAVQRDWVHVVLMLAKERRIDVDVTSNDGITPLMLAAREGRTACLSALLQSGNPDLDKADSADRTPIIHAAYRGESECVQCLLGAGCALDVETIDGTTLLMAACYGGLEEFAERLVDEGADIDAANDNGFTALLFASVEGYPDTAKLLLEKGASIEVCSLEGVTPMMAACGAGQHELVMEIIARSNRSEMDKLDKNGWTAIMHAVAAGSEKCGAILMKAGASVVTVGKGGYTLLSIAVVGNLVWMVKHILSVIRDELSMSNRAEIQQMLNSQEHGGFSCVHEAAGTGAHECLSLLVRYNEKYFGGDLLDLDLSDNNGRTPLMIACLNGHLEAVNLLLNAQCCLVDCNKCDGSGNSVLLYAVESGQAAIVRALVRHPVHGGLIDSQELLGAKDAAEMQGAGDIGRLLQEAHMKMHALHAKSSTLCKSDSLNKISDDDDFEDYSD